MTCFGSMRSRSRIALAALLLVTACAHGDHAIETVGTPASSAVEPSRLPQYVVADPHGNAALTLALGTPGAFGLVVERRRIVVGRGAPRVAEELPSEPFTGAIAMPARLGKGFVFWTSTALFRADSFDGRLIPLAHFHAEIESLSRLPAGLLIHARNGERWAIDPKGGRIPILPLGAADVEALDDGRAVAWTDAGTVLTSTDGGAHWVDATTQMHGTVDRVFQRDDELWAMSGERGGRVEHDGRLSWFEHVSVEPTPLRAVDPRWKNTESPLRIALASGASVDETTALVIDAGDLVKIDLPTGAICSVTPASLPPDARCESVSVADDVLFACKGRGTASNFVVAHVMTGAPTIERTFGATSFTSSDDGGLLVTGPCGGGTASIPTVCVRQPGGQWEDRDLAGLTPDGGPAALVVARWVPRGDGHAVALLLQPELGMYDPSTGAFTAFPEASRNVITVAQSGTGNVTRARAHAPGAGVDGTWSFTPDGALRGWQRGGEMVHIRADGAVVPSPYVFASLSFAGGNALAVADGGRLYQSTDHGGAWTEVAAPPAGIEANELGACSLAGCELGAFFRLGWSPQPPRPQPPQRAAAEVPEVRRTPALELACRSTGPLVSHVFPRTSNSPDDLGLGSERLKASSDGASYVRETIVRGIVAPVHEAPADVGDAQPSLRAIFSGYSVDGDTNGPKVSGPNPSLLALRRGLAYVPPFDPSGRIIRTSFAVSDIVAAARRAGASTDELLTEDPTRAGTVATLLPLDPQAVSDIALHNTETSILTIVRGGRARHFFRSAQEAEVVVSGVQLPNDEAAFLETSSGGLSRAFKVLANGATSELFEVSVVSSDGSAPANGDALALGPRNELAVIRTPSGSEPASAYDPALLLVPGQPPLALAPWSTAVFEGDAACKAEPGGYRAVVQLVGPWVHLGAQELQVEPAPMIARVRWTANRVCLEGIEIRTAPVALRVDGVVEHVSTWLVGHGGSYARVATAEGIEWRQPLECTITR